jgi:hypothetical protein
MNLSNKYIRKNIVDKCGIFRDKNHIVINVKYNGLTTSLADLLRTTARLDDMNINVVGVKSNPDKNTVAYTCANQLK